MREIDQLAPLAGIRFAKMTGTGNDFILMDNRAGRVPDSLMPLLARAVCCRRRSVGADGLILLESAGRVDSTLGPVDFRWQFFNADGSSAEMCGNGGRCAARFAFDQGLAGAEMVFDTLAGPIRARVDGAVVKLEMTAPQGVYRQLCLSIDGRDMVLDGVNTGVPHAVLAVDDIEAVPVAAWGREIRFHQHFAPAGSNANFASPADGELLVRTYERGVEDETLACGTGVVASALMCGPAAGLESPVTVRVRSGETLKVHFKAQGDRFREVFLEGGASYVYWGDLNREAFDWLDR